MPDQPGWDAAMHYMIDDLVTLERLNRAVPVRVAMHGDTAQDAPAVLTDWWTCGALAAEALLQGGEREVIGLDVTHLTQVPQRFMEGVRRYLIDRGRGELWREFETPPNYTKLDVFVEILRKSIVKAGVPLAFAYPHAGLCVSLQQALVESGLSVPRDLTQVAVDKDIQRNAELAPVSISAVKLDEWRQGFRAAELLHQQLLGGQWSAEPQFIAPLVVEHRASTLWLEHRDPYVERALELIRQLYSRKLSVDELAQRLHIGRRTLEIRFRAETGCTIQEVISSHRLEMAKRLLGKGGLGMAEVAERCGYASVHYFSNVFKKASGVSPARWRDGGSGRSSRPD